MKNLEKLLILIGDFSILIGNFKSHVILFHKSLYNLGVIFNQVLNLCVYRIVLLIPAAVEFILREIPANIYWI